MNVDNPIFKHRELSFFSFFTTRSIITPFSYFHINLKLKHSTKQNPIPQADDHTKNFDINFVRRIVRKKFWWEVSNYGCYGFAYCEPNSVIIFNRLYSYLRRFPSELVSFDTRRKIYIIISVCGQVMSSVCGSRFYFTSSFFIFGICQVVLRTYTWDFDFKDYKV